MKSVLKNGLKIFLNYIIVLVIFGVFIYPFIAITGDNFGKWLPVYSIIIFLLMFLIIYTDMKSLAKKEIRPQYGLNPFPLKGLLYGAIGAAPVALLVVAASVFHFGDEFLEQLKGVAVKAFMGPVYFMVKWLGKTPSAYGSAILLLPLAAMLGYLAGFYNVNITEKLKKKKETTQEKPFAKSPWNPTNIPVKGPKKKKKKS